MIYLLWGLGLYVALGIAMTFYLLQTPCAENPIWTMVLLWPLYLLG